MKQNIIYNQDCVEGMLSMPAGSVDIVVTSPPYNLNIKYGKYKDDLPRESYLKWLHDVFSAINHCLKDDGHFFLNMGYSNIDPWVGMDVANVARESFVLQNNISWVKSIHVNDKTSGHFKPINSNRFTCPTWEHLFHFTKTGKVEVDRLAVGVPYEYYEGNIRGKNTAETKPNLRDKGNCWFVPYETISNRIKHRGKHPATFPIALIEQCIKFSGVKNGLLVDPFIGSGTSAIAAIRQNVDYIGFDIDQDYIDFANIRIQDANKEKMFVEE